MMRHAGHICGCYVLSGSNNPPLSTRQYLPQLELKAHTTIHAAASSTTLSQKYTNASEETLKKLLYTFPLYDGVSVVGFECRLQDRVITGVVKEKQHAKATYDGAVNRGETAGLLEQSPSAADVFTTTIGNIPPRADIHVRITYVGELKHDAEVDGIRFTVPTAIAPRYGSYPGELMDSRMQKSGMEITIDVSLPEESKIQKLLSPSHPLSVSIGVLSSAPDADMALNMASASLALESAELEKDFVLQLVAKDSGVPRAMLEPHPTIAGQKALMTTLVPKFNLKPSRPEIIFIADRSGSMNNHMSTLKSAMQVFLKSMPVGVKFNICSFGSDYKFFWPQSKPYTQATLDEATKHVKKFSANFGGTETFAALKATIESRLGDMPTEIMLLTDGAVWSQHKLCEYLNDEVAKSSGQLRVFSIGIGDEVSSALIEGVARAGNGFSQLVANGERLESKLVRMLKGALSPHLRNCELQVKYHDDEEDFEIVEKLSDSLQTNLTIGEDGEHNVASEDAQNSTPMSLYDTDADKDKHPAEGPADRFAHLPDIPSPTLMQVPSKLPLLFPFSRTYAYLLMSPKKAHLRPQSVILKATSPQGPLELEIAVDQNSHPDQLFHQLAAKRAMQELEEGRGWINDVKGKDGKHLSESKPSWMHELREREAIRMGVKFQVAGEHCSFVAVDGNGNESVDGDGYEYVQPAEARGACDSGSGGDRGMERFDSSPPKKRRTGAPARKSTSGMPPMKQLGSRAAVPSSSVSPSVGDVGFGAVHHCSDVHGRPLCRGGGRGMRRGAMRHRKIIPQPSPSPDDDEDEDEESNEEIEQHANKSDDLLSLIISKQSFEGFWLPQDVPWEKMGTTQEAMLKEACETQGLDIPPGKQQEDGKVVATFCVLSYLVLEMTDRKDEWELVFEKAARWIEDGREETPGGEGFREEVAAMLARGLIGRKS